MIVLWNIPFSFPLGSLMGVISLLLYPVSGTVIITSLFCGIRTIKSFCNICVIKKSTTFLVYFSAESKPLMIIYWCKILGVDKYTVLLISSSPISMFSLSPMYSLSCSLKFIRCIVKYLTLFLRYLFKNLYNYLF